jgi:aspartate/methionine/tyrosine aminotransferase
MVMDVIAAANALERASVPGAPPVLRMEVGQPATGAPGVARAAVARALTGADPMGYTEALGRPSLRARISRHYADWYGLEVDPARIAVTSGASGAFPLAFLSCFDAGDTVAMAAPYYPPYVNTLSALGMRALVLETGAETRFQLTVAMLEALRPLPAGVLVASPGNPAGTMLRPAELAEIAGWCAANGVRLISDEIYHGLNYEVGLATAAAFADAVVVNSFSKYFCMTGWRIGWMVLPETLVRPVERLAQNFSISAPHVSQIAAEAAFEGHGELLAHVAQYRRARDVLLAALPGAWRAAAPEGAFYLYVDLGPGADSVAFSTWLLAEHRIACAPGLDFDSARGGRFARFSYAGAAWAMEEAARRLRGLGGAGRVV